MTCTHPRYLSVPSVSESTWQFAAARTRIKREMASTASTWTRRGSRHSCQDLVTVSGHLGLSLTSRTSGCRWFGLFCVLQSKLRAASIETRAPVRHLNQCTCLATWKINLLLLLLMPHASWVCPTPSAAQGVSWALGSTPSLHLTPWTPPRRPASAPAGRH